MSILKQARDTQLRNIEAKTGKNLQQLREIIKETGLSKHGQIRDHLRSTLGLGHGDANTLVHLALATDGQSATEASGSSMDEVLAEIYSGPKANLRPIYDRFSAAISGWGDFESVPKKGYLSLRRKKQFAMIGPATKDRVEIGLNMKGVDPTARLLAEKPGGMCQYKVKVVNADEVDAELLGWVKSAFDAAG